MSVPLGSAHCHPLYGSFGKCCIQIIGMPALQKNESLAEARRTTERRDYTGMVIGLSTRKSVPSAGRRDDESSAPQG
jgi:hypothetical protein